MRFTVDLDRDVVDVLQKIRRKRNIGQYERPGSASEKEAAEARRLAVDLRQRVLDWLAARHLELLP
jgi:hypothetical protein